MNIQIAAPKGTSGSDESNGVINYSAPGTYILEYNYGSKLCTVSYQTMNFKPSNVTSPKVGINKSTQTSFLFVERRNFSFWRIWVGKYIWECCVTWKSKSHFVKLKFKTIKLLFEEITKTLYEGGPIST